MKNIILYLLLLTTCLFADNYDDMFNELEGITSIVILDSGSKKNIEGARVQIGDSISFSDMKGLAEYNPAEEEVFEDKLIPLAVDKEGYIEYRGNFRAGKEKEMVYLKRIPEKKPLTERKKLENGTPKKKIKIKNISSKVRVLALEDGDLYLADRKLRSVKSGMESFIRVKEGIRTLTLDTEKAIYRKEVNIAAPEIMVVFTKGDIIKIKESIAVKPKKSPEPSKEVANKVSKKEKSVDPLHIPEDITNEYLIEKIVKPLEDGSAFNIRAISTYFEMEEDEDKGEFVELKDANGNRKKMSENIVKLLREKIEEDDLLNSYYYVVTGLEVNFREEYLNKVETILGKIAREKQEYASINTTEMKEGTGKYLFFSSAKRINEDEILNKSYRISYKDSKKYGEFFTKLNNTLTKERKYRIRVFDNNSATVVFNMTVNSHQYYRKYYADYYPDIVHTDLVEREVYSTYSSMGSYIEKLNYNLLGSLYRRKNEYYFLNNDVAKINVSHLKKNDGRKIIRSEYERVR